MTPIADLTSADDASGSVSKFKLFDHAAFDFSFDKHEGGRGSGNWSLVDHQQHGSDETSDNVCVRSDNTNEQNDPTQAPQGNDQQNNEEAANNGQAPGCDSEDQNEGPFNDWCPPPAAEFKERESDQTSENICDIREDPNEQNDPPQAPQGSEEHNNEDEPCADLSPSDDSEDQQNEGPFDDWCPPPVADLKECFTEFRQDLRELFRDYCERPAEVDFRVELTQTLDHLHDCIDAWRDSWHQSTGT